MRSAKIKISLRICTAWSEYSLGAFWIANDVKFPRADNEDFLCVCTVWVESSLDAHARRYALYVAAQPNSYNVKIDYENTPIQIYRKFHLQKRKIFR